MHRREDDNPHLPSQGPDTRPDTRPDVAPGMPDEKKHRPREIGGRDGPDPTRYGDWEKNGRCIDF